MEEDGPQYPDNKTRIDEETEIDEFEMQTRSKGAEAQSHLDMV